MSDTILMPKNNLEAYSCLSHVTFHFVQQRENFLIKKLRNNKKKKKTKNNSRWITMLTTALTICVFNSELTLLPRLKIFVILELNFVFLTRFVCILKMLLGLCIISNHSYLNLPVTWILAHTIINLLLTFFFLFSWICQTLSVYEW